MASSSAAGGGAGAIRNPQLAPRLIQRIAVSSIQQYNTENPQNGELKDVAEAQKALQFLLKDKGPKIKGLLFGNIDDVPLELRSYIEKLGAGKVDNPNPNASQCGKATAAAAAAAGGGGGGLQSIQGFQQNITKCWLCNCPITGATYDVPDGPQCEHIIPALRAVMFLGMFTTNKIEKEIKKNYDASEWEAWLAETARNYLWAHRLCNVGKSDDLIIDFDPNTHAFIPDKTNIMGLQGKIAALYSDGKLAQPPGVAGPTCWVPPQRAGREAIWARAEAALEGVNERWREFVGMGGNLEAFAEYCLHMIKMYLNVEETELTLDDLERAQRAEAQAAVDAAMALKVEEARQAAEAKLINLYTHQLEIMSEIKKAGIVFYNNHGGFVNPQGGGGGGGGGNVQSSLPLLAVKNHFEKILFTYCKGFAIINEHKEITNALTKLVPSVQLAGTGIIRQTLSIMALFAIVALYGWEKLVNMPFPAGRNLAKLYAKLTSDTAGMAAAEKRFAIDRHMDADSNPTRSQQGRIDTQLEKLFPGQTRDGNLNRNTFASVVELKNYLANQITVLIATIITQQQSLFQRNFYDNPVTELNKVVEALQQQAAGGGGGGGAPPQAAPSLDALMVNTIYDAYKTEFFSDTLHSSAAQTWHEIRKSLASISLWKRDSQGDSLIVSRKPYNQVLLPLIDGNYIPESSIRILGCPYIQRVVGTVTAAAEQHDPTAVRYLPEIQVLEKTFCDPVLTFVESYDRSPDVAPGYAASGVAVAAMQEQPAAWEKARAAGEGSRQKWEGAVAAGGGGDTDMGDDHNVPGGGRRKRKTRKRKKKKRKKRRKKRRRKSRRKKRKTRKRRR